MHYKSLAIADPVELTFDLAPKPVTTRSGMVIGGGTVYPELNFTLRGAHAKGKLRIAPNEVAWFGSMRDALDELPENESEFIAWQLALADRSRFLPEEYGLKA